MRPVRVAIVEGDAGSVEVARVVLDCGAFMRVVERGGTASVVAALPDTDSTSQFNSAIGVYA